MARRKRYGDTAEGHIANGKQAIGGVVYFAESAERSLKGGNCKGAGRAIDQGYMYVGDARTHAQSAGYGSTKPFPGLLEAYDRLKDADDQFEKRCVLSKPSSTALGRYRRKTR